MIEEAQLAAIAAQFGVVWQPGTTPTQVTLEHSVRHVGPAEYMPLVRTALQTSGASADVDIHLLGDPIQDLPSENNGAAEIDSVTFEPQSGAFSVGLRFFSNRADASVIRITGVALEMVDVPVLKRSMGAGSIIASGDLQTRRLRRSLVGNRTLLVGANAVGLALHNQAMAGVPLSLDALQPPVLVVRGMAVTLHFESAGLVLTATGEAIEPGSLDDHIHIYNPSSRSVVVGRVVGPGAVQLDPVVAPIFLASQQSGLPQPYNLAVLSSVAGRSWPAMVGSGP